MSDRTCFLGLLAIAFICVVLMMITAVLHGNLERELHRIKSNGIETGQGYYHPKTGKYTWKEREKAK